jgi:CheY-like chemotaxis protein
MTTGKMPTIVVVDDSPTSIGVYRISLQKLAVHFVGFSSPAAALPYLSENAPDLLFLDIVMPGMDGLTFLKKLRDIPLQTQTPVIMVTSKDYMQDRGVAKQLGALEFMIKPIKFKEIRDLVLKYAKTTPQELL